MINKELFLFIRKILTIKKGNYLSTPVLAAKRTFDAKIRKVPKWLQKNTFGF